MDRLKQLRDFAQACIDESNQQEREVGKAGAHEAITVRGICERVIADLDAIPAPPSPLTVDAVMSVVCEARRVPIARYQRDGQFSLDQALDAIAEISAVTLAGRTVAQSSALDPALIPPLVRRALDDYAAHGIRPGACLSAILSGDLFAVLGRADHETAAALPAIVAFIVSSLMPTAYGSSAAFEAWLARPRS